MFSSTVRLFTFFTQCFLLFNCISLDAINNGVIEYNFRCPGMDKIKPCDCLEIQKGLSSDDYVNESFNESIDDIPIESHPDIIETVVFCKHIYDVKSLIQSISSFKGHRINYLVIDSCNLPSFPNNLFKEINVLWMEILNSTIQFREQFFDCASNCL